MHISAPFIHRPVATTLLSIALLLGGAVGYVLLPVSSLPEVVGNAAVLVHPENVFEIMRALHRVLMDQPLREKMKERSYRQAAKFSWEKSVRRIMEAYREVLGAKGKAESTPQPDSAERNSTAGVA